MIKEHLKPREFDEDKIEHCAEILLEAEDIKKDGPLMTEVENFLKNKKKKITTLQELKDKANNFTNEVPEEVVEREGQDGHLFQETDRLVHKKDKKN